MKVLVTANIVPFMRGGAENHIEGLVAELEMAGVDVNCVRFPFRFSPLSDISNAMAFCESQDFNCPNGVRIDKVISLQFPAYGVQHDDLRVWVMHQHRAVYELYDQQEPSAALATLKQEVTDFDNRVLSRARLFANSGRVAARLAQFNHLKADPLYHPPKGAQHFYSEDAYDYVFCPSRLERLKRQDLLIEAARFVKTPVKIVIAGDGGQKAYYQSLVEKYALQDRVVLMGNFSEAEKYTLYARALAVFFAPYDEDYGYITLEAMLSAKPVITCEDSGGPLEFVEHGQTGYVLPPEPAQIAEAVDHLYRNKRQAYEWGQAGKSVYQAKNIRWSNVIERLLS